MPLPEEVEIALEEYKLLRAEIIAQFQNRNQILSFGSAALAFLVGAAVEALKQNPTLETLKQNPEKTQSLLLWIGYFISVFFIPSVCALVIISWLIDSATIARIGAYLATREKNINSWLQRANHQKNTNPINWENWLRQPQNNHNKSKYKDSEISFRFWLKKSWNRITQGLYNIRKGLCNRETFSRYDILVQSITVLLFFTCLAWSSVLYATRRVRPLIQNDSHDGIMFWIAIFFFSIGLIWAIFKIVEIHQNIFNPIAESCPQENRNLLLKHRVSLEEAKTVFNDPLYLGFYAPGHSDDENRYLIIGESNQGRLLTVYYTKRGNSIRFISVREVTRVH